MHIYGKIKVGNDLMVWDHVDIIDSLLFPSSCTCVPSAIPKEQARKNPNLILITTGRGGHIGFMDSMLPFGKCLMDRVLIQFAQLTLKHNAL